MRCTALVLTLLLSPSVFSKTNVTGLWNTFDGNGSLLSTVIVKIENAKLYANIVAVHTPGDKNPLCNQCKGDLYGTPIVGMQIINGLTLKNNIWQKGSLFDPKTGDSFKGKVWLKGEKLLVRGYLGFLYQTQYWEKALSKDR